MKLARTTKTPFCRALAVACCFALLPVLVCAQNTDDKNKKKAAPAPAQQPAAGPGAANTAAARPAGSFRGSESADLQCRRTATARHCGPESTDPKERVGHAETSH